MTMHDGSTNAAAREDERLQADPEMHEGPVGMGRILMTAVLAVGAIVLVLYGINVH